MTTNSIINLFSLNASSGIPIYRQLIDQIKQAIRMNLLQTDQLLPSVRIMATTLQINPMTVSKAFAQLELENVLVRKRGVGMMVAACNQEIQITAEINAALDQFITLSLQHGLTSQAIQTLVQQALSINLERK